MIASALVVLNVCQSVLLGDGFLLLIVLFVGTAKLISDAKLLFVSMLSWEGVGEMPVYEYQCQSCGYRFDAFQKMSDEPPKSCPQCQGEVKRLISGGTGVVFKGSGFYATDYRDSADGACCGMTNPCDNPKRCCGR